MVIGAIAAFIAVPSRKEIPNNTYADSSYRLTISSITEGTVKATTANKNIISFYCDEFDEDDEEFLPDGCFGNRDPISGITRLSFDFGGYEVPECDVYFGWNRYEWLGVCHVSHINEECDFGGACPRYFCFENNSSKRAYVECIRIYYSCIEDEIPEDYRLNYELVGDSYTLTSAGSKIAFATIPETYNGKPVDAIGDNAFYGNKELKRISISKNVESIGGRAFSDCTNLTSFNLRSYSKLRSIGMHAFTGCESLTSISIPEYVESIDTRAFMDCRSLTTFSVDAKNPYYESSSGVLFNKGKTTLVNFPNGKSGSYSIPSSVTTIGEYSFACTRNLTSVTIPSSVKTIGQRGFAYSTLPSISVPNSVTSIGWYAFAADDDTEECLTSITLGTGITTLISNIFANCLGLTSFVIPDTVATIEDWAFYRCSNLNYVVVPTTVTSIGYASFFCSVNKIFYKGTSTQWSNISKGEQNTGITSSSMYYYSEGYPSGSYHYWHYVGGVPTVWY